MKIEGVKMNQGKQRIKLDYGRVNMTPYAFEKKLVEEAEIPLFEYDDKGKVKGLNYFNFAVAASELLKQLSSKTSME